MQRSLTAAGAHDASNADAPMDARPSAARGWRRRAPLLLLAGLSAVLHFARLSEPRSVVFDEVHFGSFASAYVCDHRYFFDVHPPHAKLLIGGVAKLLGYGCQLSFDTIGRPFTASPFPLRALPALAGTSLPLLCFALLRLLGASTAAALFGGLVVALDGALTLHTRVVGPDAVLVASILAAFALWLAAERARSRGPRIALAVAAGAFTGLAVGSKFLGLVAAGLGALVILEHLVTERTRASAARWLGLGAAAAGAAIVVYAAGWILHFVLLTNAGPGDVWGRPTGHLLTDILGIHRRMLAAGVGLQQTHPYASPWWSWPLMVRPIFYWTSAASRARMYLVGNPVVWWGGTLLFVVVLVNLALARVTTLHLRRPRLAPPRLWLLLAAYAGAYLPLAPVHRVLFLYHYFTPLLFSLLAVVLWLDHAGWTRPEAGLRQRASYYGAIALVVAGFVAVAPLTYGLTTGAGLADAWFRIFPGWR